MLIAEEFLLLALDDASGRKTMGAESLELALGERIGVTAADAGWRERGRVRIVNPAPTDDAELDELLGELQRRDGAKVKDLISPMSTERTTALIALLQATNRVTKVVHTEDKAALKARAKQLSSGDWAAKAVKDAID